MTRHRHNRIRCNSFRTGGLISRLVMAGIGLIIICNPVFSQVSPVREYYRDRGGAILREYRELLRIPNVASDRENIRRNVDWIIDAFEKRGVAMERLELPVDRKIPPIIYGELEAPRADRTLVLYIHYDGQPVDPQNWTGDPWEPTVYSAPIQEGGRPLPFPKKGESVDPDWRIYGRSSSDDRAPIAAILSVLDYLRGRELTITSNLKFFLEGEEEAGSPHLREYLKHYREKLQADIWLFCDGPKHQSGRPQVVFGVRGITGLELTVYGANRPLHSGHYGGWAPVPGQRLANLLAGMREGNGKVLIEGFYDGTAPITDADRRAFATLPEYDEPLRRELGLAETEFEGRPLIESYMYPTLTVKGLKSGNVGERARNIIPSSATASLGIRLAEGNDPETMKDLVEAHIRKQGFHIVREPPDRQTRLDHAKIVRVVREGGYPAARTSIDHPLARQIVEAVNRVSPEEVILYPTFGGSLPLYHFEEVTGTPFVIVPIANHDNNQHAPDENIRIGNIWYGMEIFHSIFTME